MSAHLLPALKPIVDRVRTDVTATKVNGQMIWAKGEALTEARLRAHLNGGQPRGCCPIKAGESTTRLALLDLDSHQGQTPWDEMVKVAELLFVALETEGCYPVAFRSTGGRGVHIFVVWDEDQDAYSVRTMLSAVLASAGYKNGTRGVASGEVEVFPKQASVPPNGFGSQFILPLAGKSEPLEPLLGFEPAGRDHALAIEWRGSAPVSVVEAPVVERQALGPQEGADLRKLQKALAAIPNDGEGLGYDEWCRVVWGVHEATGGSEEGYALALDFSARSSKFEQHEFDEKVWGHAERKGGEGSRITAASVFAMARDAGWEDRAEPEDFEVLPALYHPRPAPSLKRNKAGEVLPTATNLQAILQRPDILGFDIRFDQFQHQLVIADWTPESGTEQWRLFEDEDYQDVVLRLEDMEFKPVSPQALRSAISHRAREAQVDTAMLWASLLKWDGVPRIRTFLTRYFGTEDTPYNRAVALYAWTAMAGRVFSPGCQADMVPILFGGQGAGKSSGVAALVPKEHHRLMGFDQNQDALSRLMRGALVVEIAELNGLRSRAIEAIKSWITRRQEEWVPKYKEFAVTMGRRCIFWGTTNDDEIFDDPTGERRWLPVRVGDAVDVEALRRDRDQLWAEAVVLFREKGVVWAEAEALAKAEHGAFRVADTWEDALCKWALAACAEGVSPAEAGFNTREALIEGLGFSDKQIKRSDEMRCAKALKSAGFTQERPRVEGQRLRVWRGDQRGPT